MSVLKNLADKRITNDVKFMGETIKIKKLSIGEVEEIQKAVAEDKDDGIKILRIVVNLAVEGAAELTEEEFKSLPIDELSKLSEQILKFSGVTGGK